MRSASADRLALSITAGGDIAIITALTFKCVCWLSLKQVLVGSAIQSNGSLLFLFRVIAEKQKETLYTHQKKYIQCWSQESKEPGFVSIKELAEAMCRYDLDDMDLYWLHVLNHELERMGKTGPMIQRDA